MSTTTDSRLRRLYRPLYNAVTPDTTTISVGNVTAELATQTPTERDRLTGHLAETNAPVIKQLYRDRRPSDVIWDVGAHVGRYSCLLAQTLQSASQLIAFEPYPANVQRLRSNLDRNDLDAQVRPYGLADVDGSLRAPLTRDEAGVFVSSARDPWEIEDGPPVRFPVYRGETVIETGDVPAPNVLRVDVSGGEPRVLDGLGDILGDVRVVVATAYRDRYEGPEALERRLSAAGFEVGEVASPSGRDILRATEMT